MEKSILTRPPMDKPKSAVFSILRLSQIICNLRNALICPNFAETKHVMTILQSIFSSESYQIATSLNPHYATCFRNMGVAYYRLGCFDKAVDSFDQAIEIDPRYRIAYSYKYFALVKIGDQVRIRKAIQYLNNLKAKTLT